MVNILLTLIVYFTIKFKLLKDHIITIIYNFIVVHCAHLFSHLKLLANVINITLSSDLLNLPLQSTSDAFKRPFLNVSNSSIV